MQPVIVIDPTGELSVAPGGEAMIGVTVRNPSDEVAEYEIDVLGAVAGFARVQPVGTLRVYEFDTGRVDIIFRPPRDASVPAGDVRFGVRARLVRDTSVSATAEATLHVEPIEDLSIRLVPSTRRARRRADFRVELENRGSVAVRAVVSASDESGGQLRFAVAPKTTEVKPGGGKAVATVRATLRRPKLFGQAEALPFSVSTDRLFAGSSRSFADPGSASPNTPNTTSGTFTVVPWLGRSLLPLLLLVAIPVGAAAYALFTRDSVEKDSAPLLSSEIVDLKFSDEGAAVAWEELGSATGYELWATSDDPANPAPTKLATTEPKVTSALAIKTADLTSGKNYCFYVVALVDDRRAPQGATKCGTAPGDRVLATPTGLEAAQKGTELKIALRFDSVDGAVAYRVLIDGVAADKPCEQTECVVPVDSPSTYKVQVIAVGEGRKGGEVQEIESAATDPLPVTVIAPVVDPGLSTTVARAADPPIRRPFVLLAVFGDEVPDQDIDAALRDTVATVAANGVVASDGAQPRLVRNSEDSAVFDQKASIVLEFATPELADQACATLSGAGTPCSVVK